MSVKSDFCIPGKLVSHFGATHRFLERRGFRRSVSRGSHTNKKAERPAQVAPKPARYCLRKHPAAVAGRTQLTKPKEPTSAYFVPSAELEEKRLGS